jgi:hypothetical protein
MQQPPQPQPAPQPGQTVLIQQQPGQAPVATVAVLKRPPSNGMLAPQSGQQPIAVMMKVDPSQPGAATMVVPTGAAALLPAALAGGTPTQVVQQVSGPAQVALQAVAQSGAAILQVQQPLQSQEPTEAAAAAATTTDQQGGQQVNTLPQAFEKKLRRLEKNRESARGTLLIHLF